MKAILRIVLIFMLMPVFGSDTALGQQQLEDAYQKIRRELIRAKQNGINTSRAEDALNKAQYLRNHPELWSQQQGSFVSSQQQGSFVSQGMGPKLKTINPFGDFLFHDAFGPDGKLVTRHLDPNGLAARAEEWAKQMKTVNDQMKSLPAAQKARLAEDINAALKSSGLEKKNAPESGKKEEQTLGDQAIGEVQSLKGDDPHLPRKPSVVPPLP